MRPWRVIICYVVIFVSIHEFVPGCAVVNRVFKQGYSQSERAAHVCRLPRVRCLHSHKCIHTWNQHMYTTRILELLLWSIFSLLPTVNAFTLYIASHATKESAVNKTPSSISIDESIVTPEPVVTADVSENSTEWPITEWHECTAGSK